MECESTGYAASERRLNTTVRSTGDTALVISGLDATGNDPKGVRIGNRGTREVTEDAHCQACVCWPFCWPSAVPTTGVKRLLATGPARGVMVLNMASLGLASLAPIFGTSFSRPARADCGVVNPGFKASAVIVLLSASPTAAATLAARGEWTRAPNCGDASRFKTGDVSGFLWGDCSRFNGTDVSRLNAGEVSRLHGGDVSRLTCGDVSRLYCGEVSRLNCGEGSRRSGGTMSCFDGAEGSRFTFKRGRNVTDRAASERTSSPKFVGRVRRSEDFDKSAAARDSGSLSRGVLVLSSSMAPSNPTWAASARSSAADALEGP